MNMEPSETDEHFAVFGTLTSTDPDWQGIHSLPAEPEGFLGRIPPGGPTEASIAPWDEGL